MVETFQHYVFKEESFQFKDEYENFVSIPRHHGQKIRSRHVPRAENLPLLGLLQALQLGGRHRGPLTLPSLRPGHWPENSGVPQQAAQRWCD